ncbi:uncharacterized protein MONOS_15603 [Monocercomonoides exilis]|uniref:uncharacterized protein n=1 Tax=Monocercomonoides exilis TaxID=2049356 RepID=UPI003559A01F|nr:hypothetical protein MONOS_15603 [Monocercomonoides exilis]|eukprot:MONOS_15603.1-p1 / transcript=MONOS_15603.1 / gene=MONOS_15603 / organism=Monocercomonoides_exilis_PA203 / gene_product=unspecified product / transcript_product=unspecified product / location=Mono_scaffold01284:6282-7562(+) / protein_length=427 / sequence_SO=supercontig / SO=protein_coding / is_pseudo=false
MAEAFPKYCFNLLNELSSDIYENMLFESPDQTNLDELDKHLNDELQLPFPYDEVDEFTMPSKRTTFMSEDAEMDFFNINSCQSFPGSIPTNYENEIAFMNKYDLPEDEPKDSTFTDGFGCVENPLPPDDLSTWSSSSYHLPCYEKESPKQLEVVVRDSCANPKEIITQIDLPDIYRREETKKQIIYEKLTKTSLPCISSKKLKELDVFSITFFNRQKKLSHSFYLEEATLKFRSSSTKLWLKFLNAMKIYDTSSIGKLLSILPNDIIQGEPEFSVNKADLTSVFGMKIPEMCKKECLLDASVCMKINFRTFGYNKPIFSEEKTKKELMEQHRKRYPILLWIELPGKIEFKAKVNGKKGGSICYGENIAYSISDTFAIYDDASQPDMILIVLNDTIERFRNALKPFLEYGKRTLQERLYEGIEYEVA